MKRHIKHYWSNWTMLAVLVAVVVFLAVCMVWMLYPYHVITVSKAHMITTEAKVGETITFEFTYDKSTDRAADYTIRLRSDETYYDLRSGELFVPQGQGVARKTLLVAMEVPDGAYSIDVSLHFKVNPLRTIVVTFTTENKVLIRR